MRKLLLIATLAACLAALGAPGPAQASRGLEIGLQDDGIFLNPDTREEALQNARRIGVTRLRVGIYWTHVLVKGQASSTTPPDQARYEWDKYDDLIDAAARHGIRIQANVTGPAPAWANPKRQIGVFRPNPTYVGLYAAAVADHFRGRIDRYSVWNEPNHIGWLDPQLSCKKATCKLLSGSWYRRMYLSAYKAIKSTDPSAKVLIGETASHGSRTRPWRGTSPLPVIRQMSCAGPKGNKTRSCAPLVSDGYAHHPYHQERPPTEPYPGKEDVSMASLAKLRKLLRKLGRQRLLVTPSGRPVPIYLTEFGFFTRHIPDAKRSRYVVKAHSMAVKAKDVKQLTQYQLVDRPRERWDTSLIDADGTLQPPFLALERWVSQRSQTGEIAVPPTVPLSLPPRPEKTP